MADFCKQCSDLLFGKYYGDLSNLVSAQEVEQGLGAEVLCENCGPILVDHNGVCLEDHLHSLEETPFEEETHV